MLNKELTKAIERNTISHAYLFIDEAAAFEFANSLGATSVDFVVVENVLTKDIENLQDQLKLIPFGDKRVVLIKNADDMQVIVQNKLLKTLEEPPKDTTIILSAKRKDALLPTIQSRCSIVMAEDAELDLDTEAIALAKEFVNAEPLFYIRKEIVMRIDDRQFALKFIDALENIVREELITSLNSEKLAPKLNLIQEQRINIKSNHSVSYALKSLALNY